MAIGRYSRTSIRPMFEAESLQDKMFVPMYKTQQHQMAQQQTNDMLFNATRLQKDDEAVKSRLGSYEEERKDILDQLGSKGISPDLVSRVQNLSSTWKSEKQTGLIGKAETNYNTYKTWSDEQSKLHKDNPDYFNRWKNMQLDGYKGVGHEDTGLQSISLTDRATMQDINKKSMDVASEIEQNKKEFLAGTWSPQGVQLSDGTMRTIYERMKTSKEVLTKGDIAEIVRQSLRTDPTLKDYIAQEKELRLWEKEKRLAAEGKTLVDEYNTPEFAAKIMQKEGRDLPNVDPVLTEKSKDRYDYVRLNEGFTTDPYTLDNIESGNTVGAGLDMKAGYGDNRIALLEAGFSEDAVADLTAGKSLLGQPIRPGSPEVWTKETLVPAMNKASDIRIDMSSDQAKKAINSVLGAGIYETLPVHIDSMFTSFTHHNGPGKAKKYLPKIVEALQAGDTGAAIAALAAVPMHHNGDEFTYAVLRPERFERDATVLAMGINSQEYNELKSLGIKPEEITEEQLAGYARRKEEAKMEDEILGVPANIAGQIYDKNNTSITPYFRNFSEYTKGSDAFSGNVGAPQHNFTMSRGRTTSINTNINFDQELAKQKALPESQQNSNTIAYLEETKKDLTDRAIKEVANSKPEYKKYQKVNSEESQAALQELSKLFINDNKLRVSQSTVSGGYMLPRQNWNDETRQQIEAFEKKNGGVEILTKVGLDKKFKGFEIVGIEDYNDKVQEIVSNGETVEGIEYDLNGKDPDLKADVFDFILDNNSRIQYIEEAYQKGSGGTNFESTGTYDTEAALEIMKDLSPTMDDIQSYAIVSYGGKRKPQLKITFKSGDDGKLFTGYFDYNETNISKNYDDIGTRMSTFTDKIEIAPKYKSDGGLKSFDYSGKSLSERLENETRYDAIKPTTKTTFIDQTIEELAGKGDPRLALIDNYIKTDNKTIQIKKTDGQVQLLINGSPISVKSPGGPLNKFTDVASAMNTLYYLAKSRSGNKMFGDTENERFE